MRVGLLLLWCFFFGLVGIKAASAEDKPYFPLDVEVRLGKTPIGQVPAKVSLEQDVLVDQEAFLTIMQPHVVPALLERWRTAFAEKDFFPLDALNDLDADALYDPSLLAIIIVIAPEFRATQVLSVSGAQQPVLETLTPAFFSAGHDIRLAQRYDHRPTGGDSVRQPYAGEVDGFFRLGQQSPLYYQHLYSFSEGEPLARRQSTLFYDDVEGANRYSAGDLSARSLGFQVPLQTGGIAIERQYDEIQPFRRSFAGGQTELVLEERSRVTVEVNGFERRTVVLEPGRYDVRDLQLSDGANRVRLLIENAAGDIEVLDFDFFSDTRLLTEGMTDYGFTVGKVRESTERGIDYLGQPVWNSFVTFGASSTHNIGSYGQYQSGGGGVVGVQQKLATSLGFFGLDAAQDIESNGSGYALEFSYAWVDAAQRLDIVNRKKGKRFAPLEDSRLADTLFEADVSYQRSLSDTTTASLIARYQDRPRPAANRQQYSLSLSEFWTPVLLTSTLSLTREQRLPDEYIFFLSVNLPLGDRDRVRLAMTTQDNEYRADYARTESSGIDTYGVEAGVIRANSQETGTGRFRYTGNRFSAEADHRYIERPNGKKSQQSSLRGQVGIAFADGHVGISRSATPGFVILDKHPSLADADVVAYRNRFDKNPAAYSDALGDAVIPIFSRYTSESYDVLVENAPPFYNATDDGRLSLAPAALGGYARPIGNEANITVLGRFVDTGGKGVPYLSGSLLRLDKQGESYRVFSNASGRFASEPLPAGQYRLVLPQKSLEQVITVPETPDFMYTVDTITIH